MVINVKCSSASYDVTVGNNLLNKVKDFIVERNIIKDINNKKVLIITDDNIPKQFSNEIQKQFNNAVIKIVKNGEESKSIKTFEQVMQVLLDNNFTRNDFIIALGGGVVGDLSGFVASTYMRGIKFINIPTTTLSQIDSSVGGKTAVNLNMVKNVVGTFYQPSLVIADIMTLKTLPLRHFVNGIIEAVKMATTLNKKTFDLFGEINIKKYVEGDSYNEHNDNTNITKKIIEDNEKLIENIITQSIVNKKNIIEQDEKELGLRRVLNFGHTIGHGIESYYENKNMLHGECVALGMLCMSSDNVYEKLQNLFTRLYIKTNVAFDKNKIREYISHDKKVDSDKINVITCDVIGEFVEKKLNLDEIMKLLDKISIKN